MLTMLTQRDKNILPGGRDHETAMRLLNEPGAVLQWRDPRVSSSSWLYWCSLDSHPFSEHLEWRIKPKTMRYRVALLKTSCNFWTIAADNQTEAACIESLEPFSRWLTDWQEVEV